VKLQLCTLEPVPCYTFHPEEKAPSTQWIGGWMSHTNGDGEDKSFSYPSRESKFSY